MPQNYSNCFPNGTPPTTYTGNGTETTYNIGFPYQYPTDVLVFVDNALQVNGTDYTMITNNTQILFTTAPAGTIYITRQTTLCGTVEGGDFTAGDALTANKLNAKFNQQLFINQEQQAILQGIMGNDPAGPGFPNILPGERPTLGDLEDVNLANPIPNPSLIRWNGAEWVNNDVLESGDAWASNNNTFATTAAGDDRWLNATGGDIIGGAGIEATEAAGAVTIAVDLAGTSGLEFDGAGNAGELRIDANSGCEIVANGLNTETTAASIVQTGGTNADPAIRVATTLGDTTTNNDLVIAGGANVTVTRTSDNRLSIASQGGGGTGGDGVQIVADVAALNDLVNLTDNPPVEPDNGEVVLIQNSNNLNANAAAGDNNQDVNGLPMTVADGGPQGGYNDQIQVTVQWDATDDEWDFIRWVPVNMDARYFNLNDGGNQQVCQSAGQQWNNGTRIVAELTFEGASNAPRLSVNTEGNNNSGTSDIICANTNTPGTQSGRGVYITAGDDTDEWGSITIEGTTDSASDAALTINTSQANDTDKSIKAQIFNDGSATFDGRVRTPEVTLTNTNGSVTLETLGASENWTYEFPPAAPGEGTNWVLVERSVPSGVQLTANMQWTEMATADEVNARLPLAGGQMTGSIDTTVRPVGDDTAWNLNSGNIFTFAADITVLNPTFNAPSTGIFVLNGTPDSWGDAFDFAAGEAPAPESFPAVIPYFAQATGENGIRVGFPVEF